jgi:(E)-4-hydroxy-3-methyl-but-2-enyl pyrophosphate reductase
MKITTGKHSGFCFGVKRAYDLACVNSRDCEEIYILGKLVHNDDVCRDLKKRGVKEIRSLSDVSNATIIFTAHGIGPGAYEKAQSRGLKIIDTTCPKVMKAQRLAKSYSERGYQILIFGDKKHKEVKSILEWSGKGSKIIGSLDEAKKIKLNKSKRYSLISQTTQNVEEFKNINDYLRSKLPHFVCLNTICDSTDSRQNETRRLAKTNDAVIIIGGRDSANSRRLYEIAKSINKKTYFIENARQLKKNSLKNIGKIAISAGASTPEWIIGEIIDKIAKID